MFDDDARMYGYGGNDILTGGFGVSNFLYGGAGNDTLNGDGAYDNHLSGGSGNDRLEIFFFLDGNEIGQMFGGSGNDYLVSFSRSGQVLLDGGSGADTMTGADGRDIYVVDSARDVIVETFVPQYDNVANPRDEVRSSIDWVLATRLEDLALTGSANIGGTGNGAANRLTGNTGHNVLDGAAGNDTLDGGAGSDRMIGGKGSDTFYIDSNRDIVAELAHAGNDKVIATVSWKMASNIEEIVLSGFARSTTGNLLANRITGNGLANLLKGGAGNDTIAGGSGEDTIDGGTGADRLTGGSGKDRLTGGEGADTFVFAKISDSRAGIGRDIISDFSSSDYVDLSRIDASDSLPGDQAFNFLGTHVQRDDHDATGATIRMRERRRWRTEGRA